MAVKVAVIGCGSIAQRRHIPELCANGKAELWGFLRSARGRRRGMRTSRAGLNALRTGRTEWILARPV